MFSFVFTYFTYFEQCSNLVIRKLMPRSIRNQFRLISSPEPSGSQGELIVYRLCGSIWPRCTMPGIFVDIYFLKATILNY